MKKITITLQIMYCLLIQNFTFSQTPTHNLIDPHWQLVWEDHFTTLSTSRWLIKDKVHEHNSHTFFLKENVYISGGNLILKVNNNKITHNGKNYNYTTGKLEMRSPSVYDKQYGYFEARMKIPYRKGLYSSFWTYKHEGPFHNASEIDIVEVFGTHGSDKIVTTAFHRCYPSCNPPINDNHRAIKHTLSTSYEDWHTYALEWNKDRLIFYIDGKSVRSYINHEFIDPVRFIFSILIEESYLPPTTGSWSEYMYVDYVKVYSLKCDKNTVINEISNFNTYNHAVKKSISLSGATVVPSGSNISLRATDFIELKPGFEVQTGRELYLDVTPCENIATADPNPGLPNVPAQ